MLVLAFEGKTDQSSGYLAKTILENYSAKWMNATKLCCINNSSEMSQSHPPLFF